MMGSKNAIPSYYLNDAKHHIYVYLKLIWGPFHLGCAFLFHSFFLDPPIAGILPGTPFFLKKGAPTEF
jgi:hypothetical protein